MTFRVAPVGDSTTWALRQSVLRPHETVEQLAAADLADDGPSTAAFAALDSEGDVLATVRVAPAPFPEGMTEPRTGAGGPWRLRGMATRPDLRGQGIGTAVLARALGHVAEQGGGVVWCNARVAAVSLYERAGFVTHGEPWVDPDIGPHIVMWTTVAPDAGPGPSSGSGSVPDA